MKCKHFIALFVCLFFFVMPCEAKIYLDVYGKSFKKVTIAIPDFKSQSDEKTNVDMNELLNKDLDASGFFVVAPHTLFDRELTDEGIEKNEIKFGNWRSLGVEILCKGKVQGKNGDIIFEGFVYDTLDGTLLLAKRYTTKYVEWRKIVHRFADDIIYALTGEKGIMSSRIIFVSGGRYTKEIYTADIDGYNVKKITNYRSITILPSISPNGKYLAYTSYREGKPNLFIIDLEKNIESYTERGEGMKFGTSWRGNTLLYSHTAGKYSTIYALDVEKKNKKVLISKEGIFTSPYFSPDGARIAFVSDMHGGPQIFINDLSAGTIKRLTYSGNYNASPTFSPKGDLIAFVCSVEGAFEICTMNVDGSNQRVLTSGSMNDSPQFSPCGRYIIYTSQKGGKHTINLMLINGENKRTLKFTEGSEEQPKFIP